LTRCTGFVASTGLGAGRGSGVIAFDDVVSFATAVTGMETFLWDTFAILAGAATGIEIKGQSVGCARGSYIAYTHFGTGLTEGLYTGGSTGT